MRTIILLSLLLLQIGFVNGQNQLNSQPGYNPIVPRLISMKHDYDASSQLNKKEKLTLKEFNAKLNFQRVETYFCYEPDSVLDKMGNDVFFNPPQRLMDFYIVHHYNYKLKSSFLLSQQNIIPEISISDKEFVRSLKVRLYYLKKGKLKSVKFKKNEFSSSVSNEKLTINLNVTSIPKKSYIEIDVEVKSRNFEEFTPTFSKGMEKSEYLIRIPKILEYDISDTSQIEEGKLKMLQFYRNTTDWDKMIKTFDIGFKTYFWSTSNDSFLTPKLKLSRINYPIGSDIGFPPEYILPIEKIK